MTPFEQLSGVYAAALTPLSPTFEPRLEDIPTLLRFLAQRGCHGALLLGTTGEGPSFSPAERTAILRQALLVRQEHPEFRLLAGTGTPSLDETIELTRSAFDLGLDGVVVLPPYYFRKVSDDGLFAWFSQVLSRAVPVDGAVLGYHIPGVSGVSLSPELLSRLKDAYPTRFAGLKDSSADPTHARLLGERFGRELLILNGNDRLLSLAMENGASGAITALANLCSPDLRRVWEARRRGEVNEAAQSRLAVARDILDRYPPAPPTLKALLNHFHALPRWAVRPPLLPLADEKVAEAAVALETAGLHRESSAV